MRQKLTIRLISAQKPKKAAYDIYDSEIRGFAIRVLPNGSKSFNLRYSYAGKRRRYKLCDFVPGMSMDRVRKMALKCYLEICEGIDIQAEKHKRWLEDQENMIVEELCEEYMKEGCKRKAMSTQYIDNIRINNIKLTIGKKRVVDLTKTDVKNMRVAIENGEAAKKAKKINPKSHAKGGPTAGRDTEKLLRTILYYAIDQGYITKNVAAKIEPLQERERLTRFYNDNDYAQVAKEANKPEIYGEKAVNIVNLLALTGCRRTEIESLRWDYIDLEEKKIELPDSKTGPRTVYLATLVVELLRSIQPSNQSGYIFPSDRRNTYYKNTSQKWRLMREEAGIVRPNYHCRLHDFRHSFCSIANELGYPQQTIGALVGHSKGSSTTAGYTHLTEEFLIQAANRIANAISKKMQDQETIPTYDMDSIIKQLGPKDGLIANETVFYTVEGSALNTARIDAGFEASE